MRADNAVAYVKYTSCLIRACLGLSQVALGRIRHTGRFGQAEPTSNFEGTRQRQTLCCTPLLDNLHPPTT